MTLTQYAFRWYNDDGAESASTPFAEENEHISLPLDTPKRLRIGVDCTASAPGNSNYRLEARLLVSPTGEWFEVPPGGSPQNSAKIQLVASSHLTSGGEATTARLTPPSGSPKSFAAGRAWDDESGQDEVTIGQDQYTEFEFCVQAVTANGAVASDVYEFRVTRRPVAAEGGGGFEAETDAIIAQMDALGTAPDSTRQDLINDLVASLKTAGIWAKLDRMYVLAAHENTAALINWISPENDPLIEAEGGTSVQPVVFTQDRGYVGNGASGTAWSMLRSTDGINTYANFAQDSAHASVFVQADASGTDGNVYGIVAGGSTFTGWPRVSSGYFRARTNTSSSFDATNGSGSDLGHFIAVRRGATEQESYRNGSSLGSDATASAAVPTVNANLTVCGVGTDSTTHRIAFFSIGGALSDQEASDFYDAVSAYMTAVGAT